VCALKLDLLPFKICIITVYRSPTVNFQYFIKGLDNIIKKNYKPGVQLIICGDININYLIESKEKQELNNILNSYNLVSVINFPTRVKNNSRSAIDNIFLDATQFEMFTSLPMVNGLSDHDAQMLELHAVNGLLDHDAQMLELHAVNPNSKRNNYKNIIIRKIDFNSINEFKDKLSRKFWQNVFENDNNDIDSIFNSFLNTRWFKYDRDLCGLFTHKSVPVIFEPPCTYLLIFYSCFPKITVNKTTSKKQWITRGIINSCKRKKELYLLTRNNNDTQLKEYYMRYSKILSKVIKNAKISHYNEQIIHSNNKIKTTWNIVRSETGGNNIKCDKGNFLNTDKENNNSVNAESCNKYFLTIAKNISCKIMGSNKQIISSH
jgi:hypothetical protein